MQRANTFIDQEHKLTIFFPVFFGGSVEGV